MRRKLLFSVLLFSLAITVNAQFQIFSFESAEGYNLGAIKSQHLWWYINPDGMNEGLQGTVSDAMSTDGSRSLRIMGYNGVEGFWGVTSPPLDVPGEKIRLTLDIYITAPTDGGIKSDISFFVLNADMNEITSSIVFTDDNKIQIYDTSVAGAMEYKDVTTYITNNWYALRVDYDFPANTIKYYLNNILIYTGAALDTSEVGRLTFQHHNHSNGAYIDNIKIMESTLGSEERLATKLAVYPNPATDIIYISNLENLIINDVTVIDQNGRTIMNQAGSNEEEAKISLQGIAAGIYFLRIVTDEGTTVQKIIKD